MLSVVSGSGVKPGAALSGLADGISLVLIYFDISNSIEEIHWTVSLSKEVMDIPGDLVKNPPAMQET